MIITLTALIFTSEDLMGNSMKAVTVLSLLLYPSLMLSNITRFAYLLFNVFLVLIYIVLLSKNTQVTFIVVFVQFENICTNREVQEGFSIKLTLRHLLFH